VLEEGDVIAVEPALYDPSLASGLRLENDYLVTATGLENLSPFPLDMT
jgi:Xaa-Pro aminopeptidase